MDRELTGGLLIDFSIILFQGSLEQQQQDEISLIYGDEFEEEAKDLHQPPPLKRMRS